MTQTNLNRPWLNHYPQGVQPEISLDGYDSLVQIFDETCHRYGDRIAFTNMGHGMTYRELSKQVEKFASFLQNDLRLKKGDRIVIQMPNLLQYPVALFGAIRAGLVVVNTNPLYTSREMLSQFKDSGAIAIVILENFADKLDSILSETEIQHVILTEIGDLFPTPKRQLTNLVVRHVKKMVPRHQVQGIRFRDALSQGSRSKFVTVPIKQEDLAFLQYTGGTTGVSKAAMLTHRNLLANMFQMLEWMKVLLKPGQEQVIAALPLYHVFCLTVNCFGLFYYGANNILITNPRDLPDFIKTMNKSKPTVFIAVSTLLGGLLNHKDFDKLDLSTLKGTVAGGMALKRAVADEWFKRAGTKVYEGYGLTETSPVVACNPLNQDDRIGTIGLPLPSTEVVILGDNGERLPAGQEGELCVYGPQVMKGYWNRPDETQKVLRSDGGILTGDMAMMDPDGFFRIVDRKKDMILVSGFNVYPNEVEDVLMKHPKILEAAAIGIPDEHSGEVVKLFIVKRDPSLTEDEIKAYCRQNLTAYKCPKQIEFRTELPKTNVGKVLRRELREPAKS